MQFQARSTAFGLLVIVACIAPFDVDAQAKFQRLENLQLKLPFRIMDPLSPLETLVLDGAGRIDCEASASKGADPKRCWKAKQLYREQFGDKDLRLSGMMDEVRPHPKLVVRKYLQKDGIHCQSRVGEDGKICVEALELYKALDPEVRGDMLAELEEQMDVLAIVPLDGEPECSWSKLNPQEFQDCKRLGQFIKGKTFDERKKHNSRARQLLQMTRELNNRKKKCEAD